MAALGAAAVLLIPLLSGCRQPSAGAGSGAPAPPSPTASTVQFTDVTEAAGIRFQHTNGRSGRLYLPETVGSGCAFLDYDSDGRLDLFLVNSSRLPGFKGQRARSTPALYRNEGDGRFTDVTRQAGLAVDCYGMGVAVADYDGDGDPDLYLTALGPNYLFRNNGDGTFTRRDRKRRRRRPALLHRPPPGSTTTGTAGWTCSSATTATGPRS